jgi:hypothetical protein
MLTKLLKKGVGGKNFDLIKNMYSNTLYCCKTDEYISDPFKVDLGVKQGDSLSHNVARRRVTLKLILNHLHREGD